MDRLILEKDFNNTKIEDKRLASIEAFKDAPVSSYITCEICGFCGKDLAFHIIKIHHISCDEYKSRFNVTVVPTIPKAIQIFHEEEFDLIILDRMLGGRDGLEFIDEVQEKLLAYLVMGWSGSAREVVKINIDAVKGFFYQSMITVYDNLG